MAGSSDKKVGLGLLTVIPLLLVPSGVEAQSRDFAALLLREDADVTRPVYEMANGSLWDGGDPKGRMERLNLSQETPPTMRIWNLGLRFALELEGGGAGVIRTRPVVIRCPAAEIHTPAIDLKSSYIS